VKMQALIPSVKHNKKTDKASYADIDAIVKEIEPILKKYGFGYDFAQEQDDKSITITCELTHELGFSKKSSIKLPYDTSGKKDGCQSYGSTIAYGRRYTLNSILGITTEKDDDGTASGAKVTQIQADTIQDLHILRHYSYKAGSRKPPALYRTSCLIRPLL